MNSPPPPLPVVAAFDVDGTLTRRDCVVPFLREMVGLRRLVLAVLSRPGNLVAAVIRRDRDEFKALATRSLRGLSLEDVAGRGTVFADRIVADWLRNDTSARLRWHLGQGHEVILVSASLRPYLAPLAVRLGASAVLCCELEDDGARLTGRLSGPNCRGREKERRLRAWLDGRSVELWAYGDSTGDSELLAMADHAHLVKNVTLVAAP